jgi:predicted enzyme involved in methoxymalonyl-ACP biosynthesis
MSNSNDSSILRIFAPFALGVPSRSHFVVLRRAKAHYQDVAQLGKEAFERQGPDFVFTDCEKGLIYNKLPLIEQAIEELDRLTAARKAEIATELQSLRDDFKIVQNILRS